MTDGTGLTSRANKCVTAELEEMASRSIAPAGIGRACYPLTPVGCQWRSDSLGAHGFRPVQEPPGLVSKDDRHR